MSIVQWSTVNVDISQIESSEEVTLALLKMDPEQLINRWEGRLIIKPRGSPRISVELRKLVGGCNVLIKIFDLQNPLTNENKLIHISMNAMARFTVESLNIMNLAIAEGIAVYRLPEPWIRLNKYREEFSGERQERRKDGKFVKVKI